MALLADLPGKDTLMQWAKENPDNKVYKVNAHIHTPYSFSAFDDIPQIFNMAKEEEIRAVGVNDFYTTDGYAEFNEKAEESNVFPLFNIEFIGLNVDFQKKGIKVNDPGNPGRTYLSGKGLAFPARLDEPYASQLKSVKEETLKQVSAMVDKTNAIFEEIGSDIRISMEEIFEKYAVDQVRERHIAKIIRVKVYEKYASDKDRKAFLTKLYSGKAPSTDLNDISAVENEMRGMLLKAGGKAFVEESPEAFLSVEQIKAIILNAGGIPTYPLLADNAKGGYTDFEEDKDALLKSLKEQDIASVEFIPNRNGHDLLKEYAQFFWDNGILVTFGTEHNTPELIPLTVDTRGGVALDADLSELAYKGACVTAAHQYLVAQGKDGFVTTDGKRTAGSLEDFVELGRAVINYSLK